MRLFRPPLTPPNLGGEVDTTAGTTTRVAISPPKLGGVKGGLNKFRNLSPHGVLLYIVMIKLNNLYSVSL